MDSDKTGKEIWNMKLHELKDYGPFCIIRVPGGWIYSFVGYGVFVPKDNEYLGTGGQ